VQWLGCDQLILKQASPAEAKRKKEGQFGKFDTARGERSSRR
jgi:hypothetical protein